MGLRSGLRGGYANVFWYYTIIEFFPNVSDRSLVGSNQFSANLINLYHLFNCSSKLSNISSYLKTYP